MRQASYPTPASNEERRTGKTVDEMFHEGVPIRLDAKDMEVVASIDAHPFKEIVETLPTSGPTSRPPFKAESADGQSKSVPRSVPVMRCRDHPPTAPKPRVG